MSNKLTEFEEIKNRIDSIQSELNDLKHAVSDEVLQDQKGDELTESEKSIIELANDKNIMRLGEILLKIKEQAEQQAEQPEQPQDWPQKGDLYFYIDDCWIGNCRWDNDNTDNRRKDFHGIFRTEAEAEKVRDYYRVIRIIDEYLEADNLSVLKYYYIVCLKEDDKENIKAELKKHDLDIEEFVK